MVRKMSNADIIACVNGITEIQEREKKEKCNILGTKIKTFYTVTKNKQAMLELLKPYNESLATLIKECKVVIDKGEIVVEGEYKERFNKSLKELQSIVLDVPIATMTMDDIDGSSLTLTEFGYISFMIE